MNAQEKSTTSRSGPLLCLPFAGAGPSFFGSWNTRAPELDIRPVPLPGRERLIDREPHRDLQEAADDLVEHALMVARDRPVSLFGHCFLGAALSYEIARRLRERGAAVARLFVSASRVPGRPRAYGAERLDDEDFLALVQNITGYQHEAMKIPEVRELLLPTLRADFAMDETYSPRSQEPLDVPITAIRARDDTLVAPSEVAEWSTRTTHPLDLIDVPGGHMYLATDPTPVLDVLRRRLLPETVTVEEYSDEFAW
ncbi:MAG: hypothetical protein QG608_2423 [Actinomycetota bacterium]|nr:hypothetical protein [Actinomycetota bacterium]